jgi:hypothetical protein
MEYTENSSVRPRARWNSGGTRVAEGPLLALRPEAAAQALGVSRSFFFAAILPELRVVRRGRLRLVPVAELESWLEKNAARVLAD